MNNLESNTQKNQIRGKLLEEKLKKRNIERKNQNRQNTEEMEFRKNKKNLKKEYDSKSSSWG